MKDDLWYGMVNIISEELKSFPILSKDDREKIALKVICNSAPKLLDHMQRYVEALYKVASVCYKVSDE